MGREEVIAQSFASETEHQNGGVDTENVKEDKLCALAAI